MTRTISLLGLLFSLSVFAQSVPDSTFEFRVSDPFLKQPQVVAIDEGHNNTHTKNTGYSHISRLLEQDGFDVTGITSFTDSSLSQVDILVIINPLHDSDVRNWKLPNLSAFTREEMELLFKWVNEGGKLFLSADHMPIGGAVKDLAKVFGVEWANCFDWPNKNRWPRALFSREDGTLLSGPLTDSSTHSYDIDFIGTFTGSAFKSNKLIPFMQFDDSYKLLFPKEAWKFSKRTKRKNANGWFQGAYGYYGKGKVVFMGESAMFTAQLRGKTAIGMNSRDVPQNKLLAINIFRFLALD